MGISQIQPSSNGSNGRSTNGRFAKGDPGGPGNPRAKHVALVRSMLLEAVTDDDSGELKHVSARKRILAIPTVELHIRNARTMFNRALDDDLILYNPFDRLACTPPPPKVWHYVPLAEFVRLVHAAPNDGWRVLLSLARLAGVCRGEALNLRWRNIDWTKSRPLIIAKDDWRPKAKPRNRTVPLCRELLKMLLDAFEQADESQDRVIAPGSVVVKNASRDFCVLCARAEVERYAKPFHTLRKSCLTDWAATHPQHVVSTWAGPANVQTTSEYYLQVSESEYDQVITGESPEVLAQLLAQLGQNVSESDKSEGGVDAQPLAPQGGYEEAGEQIRTADVQLGKLAFYH